MDFRMLAQPMYAMTWNVHSRIVLHLCNAGACLFIICSSLGASERVDLEIREVGGFRRHEPISVLLTLPKAVVRGTPFRLSMDGSPVSAQFRPAGDAEQVAQWWIDFSAVLSPFEERSYFVEYGSDVEPVMESAKGHVLRETNDAFVIENAPYITWTVPRDLNGLLRSVNFPPNEHLRPGSHGLVLKDKAGLRHTLSGPGVESSVVRSGTRAVALRYAGTFDRGQLTDVKWTVDLTFPSAVSWVEVVCTVDDREGKVAALGTELTLALDLPKPDVPTLVDIGAWTLIYTSLSQSEIVEMRAAPTTIASRTPGRCEVLRGRTERMLSLAKNYADASNDSVDARLIMPEGWLHVMDRKRCLALAVDQFAKDADERLTVTADGSVGVWREYAGSIEKPSSPSKSLRFWLHFVHYPPQHSAATSPRMMQTPSMVRVKK